MANTFAAWPVRGAALVSALRWPLVALALLLLFNAALTPGFFAVELRDGRLYGVVIDVLNHGARVAIVALGMTLVIATGGVDLSVGAVAAIAGAVAMTLSARVGVAWPVAIAAAMGVATLAGAWNGVLVTLLRLQPIVATLILMVAGRGIAQLVTSGVIVTTTNRELTFIGNGAVLGLPFPVIVLAIILIATAVGTRCTALGLFIEAVGGNESASRRSGVPDRAVKLAVYAFCGCCAGVAGLVESSYIRAADSNNAGQLLELDAILAVVIGGTSLKGGRFLLIGSVVGAMLMQALTQTMYMHDVSAEVAPAPKALVVIAACLLQSSAFRRTIGIGRRQTT